MTMERRPVDEPPWSNDDEVLFFDGPVTQALDIDCRATATGRVRHSAWAVLHSAGGGAVAEIAILGGPGHAAVRMIPASVEASPVSVVRGDDAQLVRYEAPLTGDPTTPPDPLPVYLLAAEAPFQNPDLASS